MHHPISFQSRRSPILAKNGAVATSQPLASSLGIQLLSNSHRPANAADAAIAIAAALAVLEPCSTGLGGDMFALYYDAAQKKVFALNGSGRAPSQLSLDVIRRDFPSLFLSVPPQTTQPSQEQARMDFSKSAHTVTIPGAARGWEEFLKRHGSGRYTLLELLEPAVTMAEQGFPVSPWTCKDWCDGLQQDIIPKWKREQELLSQDNSNPRRIPFTSDGHNPQPGEIMYNPHLAQVLRSLGTYGATRGFYQGFPGMAIVDAVQLHGGVMTMEDMTEENTTCTFPEPISVEYKGLRVWQVPPNGQGIAGLIALKGFEALEKSRKLIPEEEQGHDQGWVNARSWHAMIEMMRLGFADARSFVCDPDFISPHSANHKNNNNNEVGNRNKDIQWLLNEERISHRANTLFQDDKAVIQGLSDPTSCTVSFQVVDKEGNAVSFVNSNYLGFGTGIVPRDCGFSLQNRGFGFALDPCHPNALQPRKRPYHTIIPCILTYADETNDLYATLSNMGGFMQPQGHFQLILNMVNGCLDPQSAIDMPRFCIGDGSSQGIVFLEQGVDDEILDQLAAMGHCMKASVSGYDRFMFGKAQIIKVDRITRILWAGSDGRSDGCAIGC